MNEKAFTFISFGSKWIFQLCLASFAWAIFVCLGGVILGVMPSSTAMFAVTRRWVERKNECSIWQVFWNSYKEAFWKSNLVGLILAVIATIIITDIRYCIYSQSLILKIALVPSAIIFLLYLPIVLYIFPVMSYYRGSPLQYIYGALVIGISNPFRSLALIIAIGLFVLIVRGFIPLLAISLVALVIMRIVYSPLLQLFSNKTAIS